MRRLVLNLLAALLLPTTSYTAREPAPATVSACFVPGPESCAEQIADRIEPARPIKGGLPTAALLAHLAAAKFAWHLPLYRQTQMLAGHGIKLDRLTLVHWIGRTAWSAAPALYDLLAQTVMTAGKVFCDTTPLPMLDRTRRRTRIAA